MDGKRSADSFHRELGMLMLEKAGISRTKESLTEAKETIRDIRDRFWSEVRVPGTGEELNAELDKAGRVADFLEFNELFVQDALARNESAGGHFREEYQTEEGEALRDDENFQHVSAWEYNGVGEEATLHKEALSFEYVKPTQRSYK